jgi:hypothetical protein
MVGERDFHHESAELQFMGVYLENIPVPKRVRTV